MAIVSRTWLVVAAERREFDGLLKRAVAVRSRMQRGAERVADFVQEIEFRGDRWILIANGPGILAAQAASEVLKQLTVDGIISTGFCGALDPELRVGDILREVHTIDRVAVTAAEKRGLRARTGARAVDMESAMLANLAAERQIPFQSIRAVSDTAQEDMPLDFNLYRDDQGRFSRARIALAGLARPFSRVPALLRLDRNSKIAAESLGEYFAACSF